MTIVSTLGLESHATYRKSVDLIVRVGWIDAGGIGVESEAVSS